MIRPRSCSGWEAASTEFLFLPHPRTMGRVGRAERREEGLVQDGSDCEEKWNQFNSRAGVGGQGGFKTKRIRRRHMV